MNLLAELTKMLEPEPMPEGAVTAAMLAEATDRLPTDAKRTLDGMVRRGELVSRVIRTHTSGGKVCNVTIYEKPTRAPSNSTTSRGACSS